MRKIISIDRPFDMVKQFLVYEDGQEIEVCSATDENRVEVLFELIEHCENFPNYSNDFEYIIDLYCNKYNLSKERLLFVVKNVSLSILKVIENPNIIKIFKTSQENFMKVMQVLDKEQLKMVHLL